MNKKALILFSLLAVLTLTGAGCLQFGGAAAGPLGIFRSQDKGETWLPAMAYPTVKGTASISGVKVYRIFEDPSDPNAMYLGTRGQGLFYSYDNGDSWRSVPFMNGKFIYGLSIEPRNKCVIYLSDGPHIYKSSDCARSWDIVYTEERPDQRIVAIANGFDLPDGKAGEVGTIYAALLGGDILKSADGGKSWRVVKRFDFFLQHITTDPFNPRRVFVASYRNGFFRSDDGGENWTDLSAGLEAFSESKNFYRLILNPGKKSSLFWVSKYGILRSDDAGDSWKALSLITPPGSVNIYGFAINGKKQNEMYYTGTILGDKNVHVRSTFYKSVDNGKNWVTKKLPTNTIPMFIRIHPEKDSMMFMGFTSLDAQTQLTF